MSKTKIAVDARPLNYPLTGIGRYTAEMLRDLVTSKEHEWHLFFTKSAAADYEFLNRENVFIHLLGNSKLTDFFKINFFCYRKIKKLGIDVFWTPRHHLPILLPSNVKTVLTIHDLVWVHFPKTMTRLGYLQERVLMRYSVSRSSKIISVSNATKSDLKENFGLVDCDISVIYPGVSDFFFKSQPSTKFEKKIKIPDTYILFVGTLQPRKNLGRLLNAYSRLTLNQGYTPPLLIAGSEGWGDNSVEALINELNLSECVFLYTNPSDDLLLQLYHNALFLVMPSLYEGFGLPILEAFASGIPVLTSMLSSMPEVGGEGACYIDPYDTESILKGMDKILSNKSYRLTLKKNALKIAMLYRWEDSAKNMLNIIDGL